MFRILIAFVLALVATPVLAGPANGLQPPITVQSKFVPARTVQIWLPPGYATSRQRYPVLYLHDGQNVYDTPSPFSGKSWEVHRALDRQLPE